MRSLAVLEWPVEHGLPVESPVRRLAVRFFLAGSVLFATAALTQPGIARTFHLPHADSGGPILNVFVYFIIGIVFIGRHLDRDELQKGFAACAASDQRNTAWRGSGQPRAAP